MKIQYIKFLTICCLLPLFLLACEKSDDHAKGKLIISIERSLELENFENDLSLILNIAGKTCEFLLTENLENNDTCTDIPTGNFEYAAILYSGNKEKIEFANVSGSINIENNQTTELAISSINFEIDSDKDGYSNYKEIILKSDPTDSDSFPTEIASIILEKSIPDIFVGQSYSLTWDVIDNKNKINTDTSVNWSSSDEAIASVNNAGEVTALSVGTVTITALIPTQNEENDIVDDIIISIKELSVENTPPVITSPTDYNINENNTFVATIVSTDIDTNELFYDLVEGDDSNLFLIDNNGRLTFAQPPDFENPADKNLDNTYLLVIIVSDGDNTTQHSLKIDVNDVVESIIAPQILSENNLETEENLKSISTITAIDNDSDTLIFSIIGGIDASSLTIDSNTGELSFNSLPDFENPADANNDNVYDAIIAVSDGTNVTQKDFTISVQNVVEVIPVINFEKASISVLETSSFITLELKLDSPNQFSPTKITVSTKSGTASEDDYIALIDHQFTIPVGSINFEFQVGIIEDNLFENINRETFTVVMDSAEGAEIGSIGEVSITIVDDSPIRNTHWRKVTDSQINNVISVAIDPNDENIIFVGTAYIVDSPQTSGLYQSKDGGLMWNQITAPGMANRAITSITYFPSESEKLFVTVNRQGIFKSLNGGETWTSANINAIPNIVDPHFVINKVSKIRISKIIDNKQNIFALVTEDLSNVPNSAGIYRSSDEGKNWLKVYSAYNFLTTPFSPDIRDFKISSTDINTIFVSKSSQGKFVNVTLQPNGGFTEETANGLPLGPNTTLIDFIKDPAHPKKLYATSHTTDANGFGGFFVSGNSGTSWLNRGTEIKSHLASAASSNGGTILYAIDSSLKSVSKSVDGGFVWSDIGFNTNNEFLVNRLDVILASNGGNLYVAGVDGLYVRSNADQIKLPKAIASSATLLFGQKSVSGELNGIAVDELTDELTYRIVQQGTKGTFSFNGGEIPTVGSTSPIFTYELNDGQIAVGTDVIRFKVRDNNGLESNEAELTIQFQTIPTPIANNDSYTIHTDGNVSGTFSAAPINFSDILTYKITQLPSKGSLTLGGEVVTESLSNNFVYNSNGSAGVDFIKYKVIDNATPPRESLEATVTINIEDNSIVEVADIMLTGQTNKTSVGDSESISYTLIISNLSEIDANQVSLTSTQFPSGTTLGASTNENCVLINHVINCAILESLKINKHSLINIELITPSNITSTLDEFSAKFRVILAFEDNILNNEAEFFTPVIENLDAPKPIAINRTISISEGQNQISDILHANTVSVIDTLTVEIMSNSSQGIVTFISPSITNLFSSLNPSFIYIRHSEQTETTDSFSFRVIDNSGRVSNVAIITIEL